MTRQRPSAQLSDGDAGVGICDGMSRFACGELAAELTAESDFVAFVSCHGGCVSADACTDAGCRCGAGPACALGSACGVHPGEEVPHCVVCSAP